MTPRLLMKQFMIAAVLAGCVVSFVEAYVNT
jgi:hypothetical protein